jgi:ABC-type Na+ efflux pump permease subunit
MTIHVPVRHVRLSGHDWVRDVLIVGAVILLTVLVVWAAMMIRQGMTTTATAEAQSLIEFRATERDSWAGTAVSEEDSLIQYRAGERP